MKRFLALLMTLALFLSCAAFTAQAEEPTVLTFFFEADPKATAVVPNYGDMAYWKHMEELFNVDLQFVHPAAGQGTVEFNLMLTSGDLPDIVWFNWSKVSGGVSNLIDKGVVLNLTDKFEEFAPNLYAFYNERTDLKELALVNGEIFYGFPKIKDDSTILVTSGFQIRDDWLAKVDMEVPDTIDELYEVLKAFKEQDVNGNGDPNDEIPFTGVSGILGANQALAQCWGIAFNDFTLAENGEVVFGPYTEIYRDYVETLAQWYAEGLIDPDYMSVDTPNFQSKVLNDQAGCYFGTINGHLGTFLTAWAKAGSDSHLVPFSNPKYAEGAPIYCKEVQSYISEDSAVITNKCKNVELAMQLLDYAYGEIGAQYANYGVEGESYVLVDGKPAYTDIILKNPNGYSATNALHMYNLAASQGPQMQMADMFKQIALYPEQVDAYNIFGAADVVKINLTNLTASEEMTNELSSIMADINTYVDEQVNRMIMGLVSLDTFDSFVEQLKTMGVEEAIAIKQAIYDGN